jgi:hypothetical protein
VIRQEKPFYRYSTVVRRGYTSTLCGQFRDHMQVSSQELIKKRSWDQIFGKVPR